MTERPPNKPDDYVCVVLDHDVVTSVQDLKANSPIWCQAESTDASIKQGVLSATQLRESHGAKPFGRTPARAPTPKAPPKVEYKPKQEDDKK